MIEYSKDGVLHLVTMDNDQNTICPQWQQRMLEIIDIIEADSAEGSALVLTGTGKFFCNGLNLEVLSQLKPEDMPDFSRNMMAIHRRLREWKRGELAAINALIRTQPKVLEADSMRELETLFKRRDRIRDTSTWPIDTSIVSRLVLYGFIAPLAWIARLARSPLRCPC